MQLKAIDQLFLNCHNVVYHEGLVTVLLSVSMCLKAHKPLLSSKKTLTIDRTIIHMLGLVLKLGCVTDGLYLALYLYDTGRYQTALNVTDRVKQKLSEPYIVYRGTVDRQRYSEAVGGQTMLTKYRKAWARNIRFYEECTYIEELKLEQEVNKVNGIPGLLLSPFVTVDICYLSYVTTD
jgi:hypothetical protein